MKIKGLLLGTVASAAALASAAGIQGTRGEGEITNHEGNKAAFSFEAMSRNDGGNNSRPWGRFRLVAGNDTNGILMEMAGVNMLSVDALNHKAQFGGGANAVLRSKDRKVKLHGNLLVKVEDHRIDGRGDPDHFSVDFLPDGAKSPLHFEGNLTKGNIFVFSQGNNP